DAVSAVVEHALDVVVTVRWHARQGDATGVSNRREHVRCRLPVNQAVLDIDGDPGKARAGNEPRRCDTAQREPRSHGWLASLDGPLDRIGTHGRKPRWVRAVGQAS